MTHSRLIAAAMLMAGAPLYPAVAHDQAMHHHTNAARSIAASQGWARATAPGQTDGGGFVTITHAADAPDRLIGVSSPVATSAQVHSMTMDHGVMRMRAVEGGLLIPPHGHVDLQPGGYHIMLLGLKHPLRVGESVPVLLRFENAGVVSTRLAVQPAGATGPATQHNMGDMPGMDMGHGGH